MPIILKYQPKISKRRLTKELMLNHLKSQPPNYYDKLKEICYNDAEYFLQRPPATVLNINAIYGRMIARKPI